MVLSLVQNQPGNGWSVSGLKNSPVFSLRQTQEAESEGKGCLRFSGLRSGSEFWPCVLEAGRVQKEPFQERRAALSASTIRITMTRMNMNAPPAESVF